MRTRRIPAFLKPLLFCILALAVGCSSSTTPDRSSAGKRRLTYSPDDPNPPKGINSAFFSYNDDLLLSWAAPYDDQTNESVMRYEIRYAYSFFDSAYFWPRAYPIADPPDPAAPGTLQQYQFNTFLRGKKIYAAIKSVDEGGNYSELSNIASLRIPGFNFAGTCLDVDGNPVSGLDVAVTIETPEYQCFKSFLTDSYGRFDLEDLPNENTVMRLRITNGQAEKSYHVMNPIHVIDDDISKEYRAIEIEEVAASEYESVLDVLCSMSGIALPVLRRWDSLPIEVYVPDTFSSEQLSRVDSALAQWNDVSLVGLIFVRVGSDPEIGIRFEFGGGTLPGDSPARGGIDVYDPAGRPVKAHVTHEDPALVLDVYIYAHELGHCLGYCIGFSHSLSLLHLMHISPSQHTVSSDEAAATNLMFKLPNGTDLSVYEY